MILKQSQLISGHVEDLCDGLNYGINRNSFGKFTFGKCVMRECLSNKTQYNYKL